MKKHIITSLITVATLSSTASHAEGLYDVYKLALNHDPGLRAAEATYRADKEQVTVTKGNLYPNIKATGSLGYAKTHPPAGSTVDTRSNSVGLDLSYPIYSPALSYGVKNTELGYQSAGVSYDNTKENLVLTTMTEFFNLLIAQATLETTEAQVKSTKSQLDQTQKQYDVGLKSITDLQDAKASYDAVQVQELTARSDVAYAQKALLQRTGKVITDIPELSKDYPIKLDPNVTVDQLIQKAIKNNKELHILDIAVEKAQNNIDLKKASGRTPVVSLVGSISRSDANNDPEMAQSPNGATNKSSVGLQVSIPLYSGGAINASVRQASEQANAAIENRASQLQGIELNIRNTFLKLQTSVAQVKAQQQLIKSRRSALEASRAGYEVGTRNLVELLQAQSNLYTAISDYQKYRYNFVIQKLKLDEAVGDLNESKIVSLDKWLVEDPSSLK
ncbi:Outer membrane protein TolC precursor [Marinomonas spartinae]|uniref:Outer membrane protein TolC n=1 Tax=Marinomonas spartinae TaxID=1792290 RepID=A0A1A8TH92_9GAMM|nr:TolC family outer membrane protein [Marinomonas spartinae]SBS31419.1 Outer membrane protein TolC precursor [Marinomonas spartinae]SBS32133.1 Outer membrane protein TolC precursor [Marinomonas spartinae]